MRIEIDPLVANHEDAHRWLDRLLHKVDDGWHVLEILDDEPFEQTAWITQRGLAGGWVRELLRAAVKRSGWASVDVHGRRIRVVIQRSTPGDLEVEAAARLAEEPLIVLVENEDSDGAFLRRIIEVLDPQLHAWWQGSGQPGRIDSRGGEGQMDNAVRRLVEGRPARPRLVVVLDSDRDASEGAVNPTTLKTQRVCAELEVPCWVSAKRESENYLPEVLLDIWPNQDADRHRRVVAWARLSDDQKDFYDLKESFGTHVSQCWESAESKRLQKAQVVRALTARSRGDLERLLDLIRGEV